MTKKKKTIVINPNPYNLLLPEYGAECSVKTKKIDWILDRMVREIRKAMIKGSEALFDLGTKVGIGDAATDEEIYEKFAKLCEKNSFNNLPDEFYNIFHIYSDFPKKKEKNSKKVELVEKTT